MTAGVSASSVTYTYDEGGRLKLAAYDNGSSITYTLDAAGNRKMVVQSLDTTPPAAPTGLAGAPTIATNINLTWTACADTSGSLIAGYKIYRGGTPIGTSATLNYSDGTVVGSTTYTYTVACYDNAGNNSAQSAPVNVASLDTTPPSIPAALAGAAPASGTVNLTWTAASDTGGSGLAGYKIYRAGAQIGTSAAASYSDTTTAGTTTYSYTVAAYDNAGNTSAQSIATNVTTPDTIPPAVPTGLVGSAPASGTVNLTWTAATDTGGSGLAGYKIYRAGAQIGTSATVSYSDTTTIGTTSYTYSLAAYDGAGNTSPQSSGVSVTTPDTIPPSVPTGLTATVISASQVNLSWTASTDTGGSGIYSYQVYRNGAALAGTLTTSYSDTGVGGSSTYTYTVAAVDHALNYSAQSAPATVTTPSNIPSAPGTPGPSGIVTTTTWTEGWAASTGPVAYYILSQNAAGVVTTFHVTAPSTSSVQNGSDGARYHYSVQACNSSNQCSGSSVSSAVQICQGGVCP